MMKFLSGLVLLVATLPLIAATPTTGYSIRIDTTEHNNDDCTTNYLGFVWHQLELAAQAVSPEYTGTIVPVEVDTTERRELEEHRELNFEDICRTKWCKYKIVCCAYGTRFCLNVGSDCNGNRRRLDLETETEGLFEYTVEELDVLEDAFLPKPLSPLLEKLQIVTLIF
jgi:hypothetical protein